MARIRTVKPEFWTSAQVMECGPLTRLLFIGMLNFADDAGRMVYSPKTLKAQIFASDDISADDIRRMIVELSSNGLLLIYSHSSKEYLQITGWKHQKIDKPRKSDIPGPFVDESSNDSRMVVERSTPDLIVSDPNRSVVVARSDLQIRVGKFQQAIVSAYAEANSPSLPETSRAELWITQGYEEEICLAVICDIVRRKPNASLSYFDKPIAEAHAGKAPKRKAIGPEPPPDWDKICANYKKFGYWSKHAPGNEPGLTGCQCPSEILIKHGIGRGASVEIPKLRAV